MRRRDRELLLWNRGIRALNWVLFNWGLRRIFSEAYGGPWETRLPAYRLEKEALFQRDRMLWFDALSPKNQFRLLTAALDVYGVELDRHTAQDQAALKRLNEEVQP